MKRILVFLLIAVFSLSLFSCNDRDSSGAGDENETANIQKQIYALAAESGYTGTYEEWLMSVKGEPGENGKSVQLSVINGSISYRYEGQSSWIELISLTDLVGTERTSFRVSDGNIQWQNGDEWESLISLDELRGESAKQIELTAIDGFISYRHEGESEWIPLVELSTLAGEAGASGTDGVDGIDGKDGREIELTVSDGYICYKYSGDTYYTPLVELASLMGSKGEDGKDGTDGTDGVDGKDGVNGKDGREVEFTVDEGFIKYKYTDEITWRSLVDLSTLAGANGTNGKDGANGSDGKDGRDPVFQVIDNILQWQYSGESDWRDLIDLGELKQDNNVSAPTIDDYDFGEFVPADEVVLSDRLYKNGVAYLKYKVGTMYYVPISYGFIQQMYPGCDMVLNYALSEATSTEIQRGISRTSSVSVNVGIGSTINGIDLDLGVDQSISTEKIYTFTQQTSNSSEYSGCYTVYSTNDNAGKYYRIALVTNVDYYVCYQYDVSNPDKVFQYISTECRMTDGEYNFMAKLQVSDSDVFKEASTDPSEYDITISDEQLTADGLFDVTRPYHYTGTYTDSDVLTVDKLDFNDYGFLICSEVQIFKQLFGSTKQELLAENQSMKLNIDYSFVINKARNQASELRILIVNDKITEVSSSIDTIDEFVNYIDQEYTVVADCTISVPFGSRNTDLTRYVSFFPISLEDSAIDEEFYIYILNLSDSEIIIKDHVYTYELDVNTDKINAQFTASPSNNTLYSGDSKKQTINLTPNASNPSFTPEEYIELGFTKLEVTMAYNCSIKGGIMPAMQITTKSGKVITNVNTVYDDSTFLGSVQNAVKTSPATVTFTIDLAEIDSWMFYINWSAMETPVSTTGTRYVSNENISIVAKVS